MQAAWQPSSDLQVWRERAQLYADIRAFFDARDVLAVETPLLYPASATDPAIESFLVHDQNQKQYLQTSPEFAMKRLLAHAPVAMYQLCKAFRKEEVGAHHQSEFTLLEWYRPHWTLADLMQELEAFLKAMLGCDAMQTITYAELFETHCALNPHWARLSDLHAAIERSGIAFAGALPADRDEALHCLMSHVIEPALALTPKTPWCVTDFPASQAALAQIEVGVSSDEPPVAKRFEVYCGGFELANGYLELLDANEQRERMVADNVKRRAMGLAEVVVDASLIAALAHGLPPCAGVALGVDRLMMLKHGYANIIETLCFSET